MDGAGHHGRRPRPVADAPAVDAAAVAKGWLLALVADAPLAQAGNVPAAELARGGPALCAGVLAALGSDEALERLVVGSGRAALGASAGRLTGARSPAALAAGVEALRAVAWRALRTELRDPAPELVADLSDRLAYVCARVAAASLAAPLADVPGRDGPLADVLAAAAPAVERRPDPAPAAPDAPAAAPDPEPEAAPEPPPAPPEGVHVVDLPSAPPADEDPLMSLAQELAAAPPTGIAGALPDAAFASRPDGPTVTRVRSVDTTWDDSAQSGPPWLAAVGRRLERREHDGLPFAVLVVEIDDLDRLLASQTGREVAFALEAAERGLTAELAPADLVVRERLGRWWLTSPDRDLAAARDLGLRVAAAIARATAANPAVALAASIGLAVCPDDGESLDALAGRADEGMFAARAAGVPLA
jgi:GGDEF domain-containing protein